jgi:hypothetical protein
LSNKLLNFNPMYRHDFCSPKILIFLKKKSYESITILTSDIFVSVFIKGSRQGALKDEYICVYVCVLCIYADIGVTDSVINIRICFKVHNY